MTLEIRLKPVEKLLFASDVLAIGKFRCPVTHPLYYDSGPITNHVFVFPRTQTRIRHDGGKAFVGNPNVVPLYNEGQLYTRTPISEIDASDWYAVADDVLLDLVGRDDPAHPFTATHVPVDARLFVQQRMLFNELEAGVERDPLEVEELVLLLLARVAATPRKARRGDADAAEAAREVIAREPAARTPLRELAKASGVSPFELCRVFRAHTGTTLTFHRHSLRLRLALDAVRDRSVSLMDLALDLGFSSHSHFTAVFKRHFGITPSQFRATSLPFSPHAGRRCPKGG
jgi:AraC family transcriptional regulator